MPTKTTSPQKLPIAPLGDRVLLKLIEPGPQMAGKLYLPQNADLRTDSKRAEVIALGEGQIPGQEHLHKFRVKVGDVVVLPPHPGTPIKEDDVRYLVHRENDLIAIINA